MPTYAEAAVEAFNRTDNEPKTTREIWKIIDDHGLKESSGRTPWATLGVELSRYSDKPYDSVEQREPVLFQRNTDGKNDTYKLTDEKQSSATQPDESDVEPTPEEPSSEELTQITEITSPKVDWRKVVVVNNNGNLEYWEEGCERYTYFFSKKSGDEVKIGTTRQNPEKRAGNFTTAIPNGELLHAIPSTRYDESALHERFDVENREGEWFFFTDRIKRFIEKEKELSQKVIERNQYAKKMEQLDDEVLDLTGV
jgi:hypothetical protein